MARVAGTTETFDGIGIREDLQDAIYSISPTDTPVLTMAKRLTAKNTLHEWQTDSLASGAASNRQIEGADGTYTTMTPTSRLGNYTQISTRWVKVSGTYDAVNKAGRSTETAYQVAKEAKTLKNQIEYAIVTNQAGSAGNGAVARSSAGLESWIGGNRILAGGAANTTGTTPTVTSGAPTAGPTDGTAATTLTEALLVSALQAAWTDGGDPSVVMTNTYNKAVIAGFAGANKYAGVYNQQRGTSEGVLLGSIGVYISDFGEHKIQLNRWMRQRTVLALDPEYIGVAYLRPYQVEELAKTGDATSKQLLAEWTLVCQNPDAHAKIQDLYSA
jgi:hypothetical protein